MNLRRMVWLGLWCAATALAPAASTPLWAADDGVTEVKAATEAYVAAFNEGQADQIGEFWAEDADYTTSAGQLYRGRKAIQELMTADSAAEGRAKLKIADALVRLLKSDVALQDGVLEFAAADGVIDRSRYTAVWLKGDKGWKLTSVRDLGALPEIQAPQVRENPLKQLEVLVGEWKADDEMASIQLTAAWKLNQQFLEFDYKVTPKEGEAFTVLQLIGWDPVEETVRSWYFDSHGGHGSGLWEKTEGGWSVLSSGVTATGLLGGAIYNYEPTGKILTLTITSREVAGQPFPDATVKFQHP